MANCAVAIAASVAPANWVQLRATCFQIALVGLPVWWDVALHQKNVICLEASLFSAPAVAHCSGDCKLDAAATKTCFQNVLVGSSV